MESPEYRYGAGERAGTIRLKGKWIDEWGCGWVAAEDGVKGEVKYHPLEDWYSLQSFHPPWEVLDNSDLSMVDSQCEQSQKFMMTFWDTAACPFQRMQFLRGTENLFMDLACGEKRVLQLRDMVHEYYMKQVELWAGTSVDGIHIEDDWGSQNALLISPALWREYFKKLYKDYVDIAHAKGKFVLMHSDGYIVDILSDLIEIGIDAVNAQLVCMNVEELAELYHCKIAFWGGSDRQYILPFGTTDEARSHAQRIARPFLRYKRTGFVGQCFIDKDTKMENVFAIFDEWRNIM